MDKMLTSTIQLNWLRTFEAAGKSLNFTQAARELNLSQSAVSQQIQLLEHFLGQKLFVRASRTIRLTDAGKAFLPLVTNTLQQLNAGATQIFTAQHKAVVDLNVNAAFAVCWLAPRLVKFNAIYPQISIRQRGTNWPADFDISTAELEIRFGNGQWPGLESWPLISPRLRPYCSANSARSLREPADIADFPLLEVIGTPQGWDTWLQKMQLDRLNMPPRQIMDSYATAIALAANGLGICLVYEEFVQHGELAKHLVAPFFDTIDTEAGYYLCYQKDATLSDASCRFRDWLLAEVNELP